MTKQKDDTVWVSSRFNGKHYFDIYSSLEGNIAALQEALAAEKSGEWRHLSLEIEDDYGSHTVVLRGQRKETEEEKSKRKAEEERAKEYRRKAYEQLKKEFECTCREKEVDKTNCPQHREVG